MVKKSSTFTVPKITLGLAVEILVLVLLIGLFQLTYPYLKNSFFSEKKDVTSITTLEPLPSPNSRDHYAWVASSSRLTVVNYFSLDCPFCREVFFLEEKNKERYGKVFSLVYRHSPLVSQPLSAEKSSIAECVYRQSGDEGMFRFLSGVYNEYQEFAKTNDWVLTFAEKHVTNKVELKECVASDEIKDFINSAKQKALMYGVSRTPTVAVFKDGVLILRLNGTGEASVRRVLDSLSKI